MFANVVLIAFLLVSAVVFSFLVLLIRQIRRNGSLPAEKLSTLTALLFIPALLVFALILYGLTNWRSDLREEKNRQEIEQFVRSVYAPLADSQHALKETITSMRESLNRFDQYHQNHPNHADLLNHVEKEWQRRFDELQQLHQATDKDIRHAWILYRTMNRQDVHDKFHTRAVQQNDKIRKVEQSYYSSVRGIQGMLLESLTRAQKVLTGKIAVVSKTDAIKSQSGKRQQAKHALQIHDFNESVSTQLLDRLAQVNPELSKAVEQIRKEVLIARQKRAEVALFLDDNPDLEQPLNQVLLNWRERELANQEALNRILYALEADYLALALGLPPSHSALQKLHAALADTIPQMLQQAQSLRAVLERSYTIN